MAGAAMHPELIEWMRAFYPHVLVVPEASLVDEGDILTTAGWNAALQSSLHVIAKVYGAASALSTAFRIDPCGECLAPFGGAAGLVRMARPDRPLQRAKQNN